MIARMTITAAQVRAARALLNLTQRELAERSKVSHRTIVHLEADERQPVPATLSAIRQALEAAGVIFIDENGEGAGVRLKKPKPRG
ncbi:helix-turn-helix domain-containing protein [Inquilinus limosus]|uniref:helix-turn-helix domain-containing protein n=1 Tax=Inquilinus limosus TaxID=171674 RepID=UPI001B7F990F|nr:helix-turn-helix transcriptional regulator [Inquilinus limosus]